MREGTLGKGRYALGLGRACGSHPKSEWGTAMRGGGWGRVVWRVVPRPTGFAGGGKRRSISGKPLLRSSGSHSCLGALLPFLLPCTDCMGTQDPCDMCVRETRESPTAHVYREGSRDLHCKRRTEINTGNTYPAGVQSKYTGHVQRITDSELPTNPCTRQPLGTHTVCTTQIIARNTHPMCIQSRYRHFGSTCIGDVEPLNAPCIQQGPRPHIACARYR